MVRAPAASDHDVPSTLPKADHAETHYSQASLYIMLRVRSHYADRFVSEKAEVNIVLC